jgi:heat shock protein HslJ
MVTRRRGIPAVLLASLALAATPTTGPAAPLPSPTGEAAPPGAGATLRYAPEVTPWRLARVRRDGDVRAVPDTMVSRLRIADGQATGSTGCRAFTADAFRAGAVLQFERLRATGDPAACTTPGESLDSEVLDTEVLAGLKHAAAFQVVPGEEDWQADLVIRDARGRIVLVYEVDAPAEPDQGLWLLSGMGSDDAEPVDEAADASPAVLAFEPEEQDRVTGQSRGRLVGSTGCNGLEAGYELRGRILRVDDLQVTDGPCPPDLGERQDAILAVLTAPSARLDVAPDRLALSTGEPDGARLVYASSSPLEGSTWQLTRLPGTDLPPEAIVTMRLDGGRLAGIGLCGAIEGRYTTKGVRFEVHDTAPVPGRCREAPVDEALIAALGRAAFVVREDTALRLLDAGGRDLVRFRHPGGP